MMIRTRNISVSGISVMSVVREPLSHEFVVGLDGGRYGTIWLWTTLCRKTDFDRTCTVTNSVFLRLLVPGQKLLSGTAVDRYAWLDVEGDAMPEERHLRAG